MIICILIRAGVSQRTHPIELETSHLSDKSMGELTVEAHQATSTKIQATLERSFAQALLLAVGECQ